jgi:hypothetical protein
MRAIALKLLQKLANETINVLSSALFSAIENIFGAAVRVELKAPYPTSDRLSSRLSHLLC